MKCPVCEKEMDSMACACGYDASRDYERYPTFVPVPKGLESIAVLRDRLNNLVRCAGCGGHTFVLNRKTGSLSCSGCGRALSAEELKPLTDGLGMKKAEEKKEAKSVAQKNQVQGEEKNVQSLMNVLTQVKEQSAEQTVDPNRIMAIAAGHAHTVVLYADGTVAAVGSNRDKECELDGWRDIVAISAGRYHTVGLKKDGTVVLAGNCFGNQKDVEEWKDIVSIATGTFHTVGLKKDGTVVTAGSNASGKSNVSDWHDIVAIAAGSSHTLALDKFGRVFHTGGGKKLPRGGWKQVKAIAAGRNGHSAALTEDGAVLITGNGGKPAELGGENVELGAGFDFTVVRKANGTAAISGYCADGRSAVNHWENLEMIAAGRTHVVGLKKDGTLVAAGEKEKGQCDVHKLMRK